jgi:hypothetical protein
VTQPRFTPIESRDEVRATKHLDPPRRWTPHRPAEFRRDPGASVVRLGTAGPDQGYALRLAAALEDSIVLGHGEHREDALALAVQVALRRASMIGRAPVRGDIEFALNLLSYRTPLSDEGVAARRATVTGVAHDHWRCREIAASVPDEVLALGPAAVGAHAVEWTATTPS